MNDTLGDRMKTYERVTQTHLVRRMPVIVRVDGKAFHTLTKDLPEKPFNRQFQTCMLEAAFALCQGIQNARLAYMQSDEISVLVTDYANHDTEAWFDNQVQKIVSVSASLATAHFNDMYRRLFTPSVSKLATFDARVFNVPADDVANYFLWRQKDAIRNSVSGLAQQHFSSSQLHGLHREILKSKLRTECGVDWDELLLQDRQGFELSKKSEDRTWGAHAAPSFAETREAINALVAMPLPISKD